MAISNNHKRRIVVIEPGKYLAVVEDFGIRKSAQKGTPSLNVKFKLVESGKNVYWEQYITENTSERLIKNLVDTGLLKTKKFSDVAKGKDGGALSLTEQVELTVVIEEYTTDSGEQKQTNKVDWVNVPGGGSMKGALAKEEAISILDGLNLDAEILAAEQSTGKSINTEPENTIDSSDIPF